MSKEDMYKLANLQYEDMSDDAYNNNKVPIMYYDGNTQEYIYHDERISKSDFELVKITFNKLAH